MAYYSRASTIRHLDRLKALRANEKPSFHCVVPIEVCEKILDCLATDHTTLRVCILVCHTWRFRVVYLNHKHMSVPNDIRLWQELGVPRRREIALRRPELLEKVKSVIIEHWAPISGMYEDVDNKDRLGIVKTFVRFCGYLVSVRDLEIRGELDVLDASITFLISAFEALETLDMSTTVIEESNFPIHSDRFHALISRMIGIGVFILAPQFPPKLRKVALSVCSPSGISIITWIHGLFKAAKHDVPGIVVPELTHLVAHIEPVSSEFWSWIYLVRLLEKVGLTLEQLEIRFPERLTGATSWSDVQTISWPIYIHRRWSFHHYKTLQHLTIGPLLCYDTSPFSCMSYRPSTLFEHLLSHLSGVHAKHITFILHGRKVQHFVLCLNYINCGIDWGTLDTALTTRSKFPALETVTFTLEGPEVDPFDTRDVPQGRLQKHISALLPQSNARGLIPLPPGMSVDEPMPVAIVDSNSEPSTPKSVVTFSTSTRLGSGLRESLKALEL